MKAVKSTLSILCATTLMTGLSASAFAMQSSTESGDMGSMFLFSAGLIGLFAARKHMKHKAS